MIYVKNIHIPKHLQVICLRKTRISTAPLQLNFTPKHPKQPIKAQKVVRTERCPFRKTFSHRTSYRKQRTRREYQSKRDLYIIEEQGLIYNKEKTAEITKQRKEIINKRRDYNEKRITRRENSREEDIHEKRIFTRRGCVRKDEINEEKV